MKNELSQECQHPKFKKQHITRDFQGEIFKYTTKVCSSCGVSLWGERNEQDYNEWLENLHSEKRHLFQVQYQLSEKVIDCLEQMRKRFAGVDVSLLTRALVTVYLNIVEDNEEIMERLETYIESDAYNILINDNKYTRRKTQFKLSGMRDLLAYSQLFDVKPSEIIENFIYRMILLSINEDEQMKAYWNSILKSVEMILKAA